MKQSIFTILTNEPLTSTVYKMTLAGDTSPITAPVSSLTSNSKANTSAAPSRSATAPRAN